MSAFCQVCKGPLMLLGILGRMEHVRCQGCGMEFSREIEVLLGESI